MYTSDNFTEFLALVPRHVSTVTVPASVRLCRRVVLCYTSNGITSVLQHGGCSLVEGYIGNQDSYTVCSNIMYR